MEERIPRRSQGAAAGDDGSDGESEAEAEFEFEFPFVSRDGGDSPALADDLFADGRIRPFYPVFGRGSRGGTGGDDSGGTVPVVAAAPAAPRTRGQLGRLFLEESRERSASTASTTSSSADDDGLEGAPPESYCVWAPGSGSSASPRLPPRKSGSTGSMARWRRISDLVVGRSHSDGKEKFLFLPANPRPPPPPKHQDKPRHPKTVPAAGSGKKPPPTEVGTVAAAHRIAYGAAKASGAGAGAPRRTFLPYREDLVGLFANMNGISRSHPHPY